MLELLKEVEKLNNNTPMGEIVDADTILVDIVEACDYRFNGFAQDIFNIYKNAEDKPAVCQMFYEFTGIEFEDYLKKCKAQISRRTKSYSILDCIEKEKISKQSKAICQ